MTQKEKWAYVSGFLDADGTITISYGRKTSTGYVYVPVICFYNTHLETLEWLQKCIGGQIYMKPRKSRQHTLCGQLNLRNRTEMYEFLPKVIPFLFRKKQQAKLLYSYLDSRTKRGWKNHTHLAATPKETKCLEEIRRLNKVGASHSKELNSLPKRYS